MGRNRARAPRPQRGRGLLLSVMVAAAAAIGCGGEPRGESVSGTVTWDGQPLEHGTIEFDPVAEGALPVGSLVEGGRYELPNPPGLVAGRYVVRITASDPPDASADVAPDLTMMADPEAAGAPIPPRYNDQSELEATVTEGGPNRFDFDLSA